MSREIRPLTCTIGAVVEGVDASQPMEERTVKALEDALLEHLVIFLRGQQLAADQYKTFGAQFGELIRQPVFDNLGGDLSEIHLIDVPAREPAESGPAARYSDQWHTDVTDEEEPPLGSILRPRVLPAVGGDTLWASMHAAYDALSPAMQSFVDSLTALHQTPRREEPVEHPVVRTHPVTRRKSLFVNRVFTRSIVGLGADESDALLQMLFRHAESVDFQVRWSWRMGDIAIWDNRATMHYAVHDYREHRSMERMTLKGDKPF